METQLFARQLIQEYCEQNRQDKSKYQCPECNGWNLSFNETTGAFNCFNGCDSKKIYKNLINQHNEKYPSEAKAKPKSKSFNHIYYKPDGIPGIKVYVRYDANGNKKPLQYSYDGKRWHSGYKYCSREEVSLFRWSEINDKDSILLVEGESCVTAASKAGFNATTVIGGAKPLYSLAVDQLSSFKKIILCPDRDRPGIEWMQQISESLKHKCQIQWLFMFPDSISWTQIPNSKGYDIADYLSEGLRKIPDNWYFDKPIFNLDIKHKELENKKDNNKNNPPPKIRNLSDVRNYLPQILKGRVRLNKITNNIELDGSPYLKIGNFKDDEALDSDDLLYFSESIFGEKINLSQDKFSIALSKEAKLNSYDPFIEYLESLPQSDYNLDDIASKYFGCEADTIYSEMVRKWLIAAVARSYEPGCQVDSVLILYESKGGVGKSKWFNSLLPNEDWFANDMGDVTDKDEKLKLHQHKILEWSEFDNIFGLSAYSNIKSFITGRVDNIRPPYGRSSKAMKRRSVLCGTTNKQELLSEPSGVRRFWIVPVVVSAIPIDLLKSERDDIWAAAYQAYKSGEKWWFEKSSIQSHQKSLEGFIYKPEYQEEIEMYLDDIYPKKQFTIKEITDYLEVPELHQRKFYSALKRIMQYLGWEQGRTTIDGKTQRIYRKPDGQKMTDMTVITEDCHATVSHTEHKFEPLMTDMTVNNKSFFSSKDKDINTENGTKNGTKFSSLSENNPKVVEELSLLSWDSEVSHSKADSCMTEKKLTVITVIDQQEELIENEDAAQNPDHQNTPNNVNGQENFKVGDKVIDLESDEEFVIVEVIKNSPYPDGQYMIENERKLPKKIRGFALEKVD